MAKDSLAKHGLPCARLHRGKGVARGSIRLGDLWVVWASLAPPEDLRPHGSQGSRYTNIGIEEADHFIVNISSADLVTKTNYVGLVTK